MPLKVLDADGFGDSILISRAIRYAARKGADVINLSFEFDPPVNRSDIPDVIRALRYARRKGVVVVGAAGNEDPAVAYPARAESVIAVGATTSTGCEAEYSNAGQGLDVVAPGGGLDAPNTDTLWDREVCRPDSFDAEPILQQTFIFERWVRRFGLPGDYEGTSMATPHVAAVAALVIATGRLGRNPSARAVERHLEATAVDAGRPGFDKRYGHGLVDAAAALASPTP